MAEDSKEAGSWWKTIPGILTGIGSTLAAAAALVAALSQAGLLGSKKAAETTLAAATSSPLVVVAPPTAERPTAAAALEPASVGVRPPAVAGLFAQLAQANIHGSVGDAVMKRWLDDTQGGYHRLAQASLALLGGRSLAGQGVDLDVVNFAYVKAIGIAGDDLPANHQIRLPLLRAALLRAYADKNGTEARNFADVLK